MDFCGRIINQDSVTVMRSLLFLHQPSVWTIGGEKTKMQCKANWCPPMCNFMMMILRILIIFESSAGGRRRYQITHHGMFLLVQPKHDSEVSSHHHLFQQCCYQSIQSHHKHGCTINKSNFQSETFLAFLAIQPTFGFNNQTKRITN